MEPCNSIADTLDAIIAKRDDAVQEGRYKVSYLAALAECGVDTIRHAAEDVRDMSASKFIRLARKLIERCGDTRLARCLLPTGWQIVRVGGTANGSMDDDYADLCGHAMEARRLFKAGDKQAARAALSLARAEMDDLSAEIEALN